MGEVWGGRSACACACACERAQGGKWWFAKQLTLAVCMRAHSVSSLPVERRSRPCPARPTVVRSCLRTTDSDSAPSPALTPLALPCIHSCSPLSARTPAPIACGAAGPLVSRLLSVQRWHRPGRRRGVPCRQFESLSDTRLEVTQGTVSDVRQNSTRASFSGYTVCAFQAVSRPATASRPQPSRSESGPTPRPEHGCSESGQVV